MLAGISYLLIRREDLLLTLEMLIKVNLPKFLEQERLLTFVVLGYTLDFLSAEKQDMNDFVLKELLQSLISKQKAVAL